MIAKTAVIHRNVKLGRNVVVEEFVIIGKPPKGYREGELETVIGDNSVIRSHTVIYAGNKIGSNFNTGHGVMIRELNEIGDNVSIGTNSDVEHHVKIGNNVRIHSNGFIPEFSELREGCWIGPNVVLTNAKYPRSVEVKKRLKGPCIMEGAIIGANATILPGLNIGTNAIVGAGSVVTRDVEPETVVVGNPARVVKKREELVYEDNKKAYR
ncbi:transferase [Candidatus Woesearchaeota archaeon]|nr:acetyltransferase [Candidatus Woesearchaeota archaeon]RLE42567.1 MAG: transferase [Candidatus Woesearchaeota archaeon]